MDETKCSEMETVHMKARHRPIPKNDGGLDLLLPLYHLLRNTCADAAHLILVKGFKEADYVQTSLKDEVSQKFKFRSFYDFLIDIHRLGRRSDSKVQKAKGKAKCTSSKQEKPLQFVQMQSPVMKRSPQIHNLDEHEGILKKVTTMDLLEENTQKCEILRDLDLSFVLNVIASEYIRYRLNETVLSAINQIKEVRNKLFHPKFTFSHDDFDKYLDELLKATGILCQLYPSESINLQRAKETCQKQMTQADSGPAILAQLQLEIHAKYTPLPNYVSPLIVDLSMQHEVVIEDLTRYVSSHSCFGPNRTPPMLLCGSPGSGKSTVLQNLANSHASLQSPFSLVLYLDEWGRRSNHQATANTINSSTEFWEQVFRCIKTLGCNTVHNHGFESVKVVIREYISRTLFLVNWNIYSLGSLFKDMQQGTWVVAYRENEPRTKDWQVLKMKPFSENLVVQFLHHCSAGYHDDVIHLYKNWEYKDILTSPDMVKVFYELRSTINFGTDFELIDAFIMNEITRNTCSTDVHTEIFKLGEVAFDALKNGGKSICKEKDLCNIDNQIKHKFLVFVEGRGSHFVHSIVQEFLAAQNVVQQPGKACKEWLTNAPFFMRVFKFACGLWCKDKHHFEENLCFIEQYLVELFGIKHPKHYDAKQSQEPESMEVDEGKKKKRKKKFEKKTLVVDNPFKNPFSNWKYFIELDDVCQGQPEFLRLFAKLLARIRCWTFKSNEMDDRMLRRIEIILKKVKLEKELPVTIKLESTADVTMLIKIWNKLKNIKSLHDCAFVKIAIIDRGKFPYVEQGSLIDLCNTIVRAHCPIYITSYKGPILCSSTPEFLKCACVLKMVSINVTVFDVASLCEILNCDRLLFLKDVSVTVDLKMDEQLLTEVKPFKIPEHVSLMLRIKYFDNIQKLLDRAQAPHHLLSLTIYDLYVDENFALDLSAFKYMENLNIRCEPNRNQLIESSNLFHGANLDEHLRQGAEREAMETGGESSMLTPPRKRVPRHSWMLPITVKLVPPEKLERLLFRNMDFYNNSNNYFLLNILKKYNIQKLVILDSQLTLKGVRQVLSSHTNDMEDDVESVTKKLKINRLEATNICKLISKKVRLSMEERERKRSEKPQGKEIVITSDVKLCETCFCFPCTCPHCEGVEMKDTVEDLVYLIEDVYEYDIVSFNYSSEVITVGKNVCGDLRVHCVLSALNDDAASSLSSSDNWLNKLFITLTLAHSISLEQTYLTFDGAKTLILYLKYLRATYSVEQKVEPFSLTIRSAHHPIDSKEVDTFIEFIQGESIFTSFNFCCSCERKCFKLKKAHSGRIYCEDQMAHLPVL